MKNARLAAFLLALLVGGLFALSLLSVKGLQKLEAGPLVRKAVEDPKQGPELATRAGTMLDGDGAAAYGYARWLIGRGHPKFAVQLLAPVTLAKNGADDALPWGALAWAARESGDTVLEKRASEEAKKLAEATLAGVGKAKVGDADALRRFRNTGLYLSEKELGGDPERAILALGEAHRIAPDDADVLNALGYTLAEHRTGPKDLDEAVALTEKALKIAPDSPMILDSYGWALYRRGKDLPAARRTLRSAVDLAIDEAELRFHLAVVCEKMGLRDEALLEAERALKLEPGHAGARALVAALAPAPKASPTPAPRRP
jgi:tetratricopeptide (TPR) repeat protein